MSLDNSKTVPRGYGNNKPIKHDLNGFMCRHEVVVISSVLTDSWIHKAALKGKFFNVLITDELVASQLN